MWVQDQDCDMFYILQFLYISKKFHLTLYNSSRCNGLLFGSVLTISANETQAKSLAIASEPALELGYTSITMIALLTRRINTLRLVHYVRVVGYCSRGTRLTLVQAPAQYKSYIYSNFCLFIRQQQTICILVHVPYTRTIHIVCMVGSCLGSLIHLKSCTISSSHQIKSY